MDMDDVVKERRTYRSERRREQADQTRERILAAALARFGADGYVTTTVAAIAAEARVAVPTIYAVFGPKAEIMAELINRAISGTDPPGLPVAQRSWYRQIADQVDPAEILRIHIANVTEINGRVGPVQRIAEGAAGADADIAKLWQAAVYQRMRGQRAVADLLARRGGLRAGMDPQGAGDTLWALLDAHLYYDLVIVRHWSRPRFERWLLHILRAALFDLSA